ncbi:MAG: DUF4007 family protein [Magnetococcales bacterium]|nr:DUF4007 family protein [Magnetococcales bacterium]
MKKSFDQVKRMIESGSGDTKAVFTDDAAIALFGVGKNMVVSMRHWSLAAGILRFEENDGSRQGQLVISPLGYALLDNSGDPYLEHSASLWMIHWHLATIPGRTTTWYWAFNEFNEPVMDRDFLTERLLRRIKALRESGRMKESRITEITVKRDVECFVRTYLAKSPSARGSHEDNLESPLCELGLMHSIDVGSAFSFCRGPKPTLPDEVFLFGLHDFWARIYPTRRELTVETVTHEPGSPGRVFMLDEESVADRLAVLADLTKGAIRWDESTGMRQVYAHDLSSVNPLEMVSDLIRRSMNLRTA